MRSEEEISYDIARYAIHEYPKNNDIRKFREYIESKLIKWISVNDRLPENETDVVFIARSRDFLGSGSYRMKFIGYYDDNFFSNQENYIGDVTYWMPLPSAPKVSE